MEPLGCQNQEGNKKMKKKWHLAAVQAKEAKDEMLAAAEVGENLEMRYTLISPPRTSHIIFAAYESSAE